MYVCVSKNVHKYACMYFYVCKDMWVCTNIHVCACMRLLFWAHILFLCDAMAEDEIFDRGFQEAKQLKNFIKQLPPILLRISQHLGCLFLVVVSPLPLTTL